MSVWSRPAFDDHELVVHHRDPATGLTAIVAIHASLDGRACGGCRMRPYGTEDEALDDVLRLSRAMSYKAALAGVGVGGAKSVIVADPATDKSASLLAAMGRLIASFGGAYIAAPDVGIHVSDLRAFRRESRWVVGADDVAGPSAPYTAAGVFEAIRTAVDYRLGRRDLDGVRIAIQGVGSVGSELARLLAAAGARLLVGDVDTAAAHAVAGETGGEAVSVDAILSAEVDVLSPNALGGILNDRTIPEIRAQIVCGAANNQLAEDRHGLLLHKRGVLFAPDFVVSAGGLIAGVEELHGFDPDATAARVRGIGETLSAVIALADAEGLSTNQASERLARERITEWRQPRAVRSAAARPLTGLICDRATDLGPGTAALGFASPSASGGDKDSQPT